MGSRQAGGARGDARHAAGQEAAPAHVEREQGLPGSDAQPHQHPGRDRPLLRAHAQRRVGQPDQDHRREDGGVRRDRDRRRVRRAAGPERQPPGPPDGPAGLGRQQDDRGALLRRRRTVPGAASRRIQEERAQRQDRRGAPARVGFPDSDHLRARRSDTGQPWDHGHDARLRLSAPAARGGRGRRPGQGDLAPDDDPCQPLCRVRRAVRDRPLVRIVRRLRPEAGRSPRGVSRRCRR